MTTRKKILIGVVIAAAAVAIIRGLATIGLIALLFFDSSMSKPEVYDEIDNYTEYMSFSYDNMDSMWKNPM